MDFGLFLLLPPASFPCQAVLHAAVAGLTGTTGDGAAEPVCRRKSWRCCGCVARVGLLVASNSSLSWLNWVERSLLNNPTPT